MTAIPGVSVTGLLVPQDSADVYPVADPRYQLGGWRAVASTAERDAIPAERRTAGMHVYVTATDLVYKLGAGMNNVDWATVTGGGGALTPSPVASATSLAGADATTFGTITPNAAQRLLWAGTRRADVAADNNLTLSNNETSESVSRHTEINAAITAMNTAGGGIVYLAPGVWWISDSIRMKSRVHLMGAGYGSTLIKLKANSNKHVIINDTGTAELYSIGNLRVGGNRDGQGVPAFTQNVWINGLHLVWGTTGFTFVDPQCYFYNLWIQECCCDNFYLDGRGGHVSYNIHLGDCRRWGANLSAWDSIYYGIYAGGCGADGFRLAGGPTFLIGCKSFFTGTRTKALTDASLRLVDGSSPITPSGEDWRYGTGYRMNGAVIMAGCESQDTCGHGLLSDSTSVVTGHRFGNIGSIGRHFTATYTNAAALNDIACVFLGSQAHGGHYSGTVNDQFTEVSGEQPQCDWLCNINNAQVRQNVVDVSGSPLYVRQASNGRFTKTITVDTYHGNDIRHGNEWWVEKIADFTAVRLDHKKTFYLKSPITTITAVAATVGANWKVRIINKAGATVTAGGVAVTNNQDGVLSCDGSVFTWTNDAALITGKIKELLASATLTPEDTNKTISCRAVLTITGTAANLGDGFRCTVHAAGGNVTWGGATINSGLFALVHVVNGAVLIFPSTVAPLTA